MKTCVDWFFGSPEGERDGELRPRNAVVCSKIRRRSRHCVTPPVIICHAPWLVALHFNALTCFAQRETGFTALSLPSVSLMFRSLHLPSIDFNTAAVPWWCFYADVLQGHFLSHPRGCHCPGSGRRKWNSLWRQHRGGAVQCFCCSFLYSYSP